MESSHRLAFSSEHGLWSKIMSCKITPVIETTLTRAGDGTGRNPIRVVTEYWSLDGKLLASVDPHTRSISEKALVEIENILFSRFGENPKTRDVLNDISMIR